MAYTNPNLLPDNGSNFEGGSHALVPGANTALAIASGGTIQGTVSVRLQATAAGSVSLLPGPRFSVVAGKSYIAQHPIRVGASAAARTVTLTITWYNAATGGTSLGTTTSGALTLGTIDGWYETNYPVALGQAPAGALSGALSLTVTGAAAGENFYVDRIYAGEQYVRVGNMFDYNTASAEKDVTGWKADTNATLARAAATYISGAGYYAAEAKSLAAGVVDIRQNLFYDVTVGTTYVAYAGVQSPDVATTWAIELRWYDAAWNNVGAPESRTLSLPVGGNERAAVAGKAPVGASRVKFHIRPQATAAGQRFWVDDASLAVAPNAVGNLLTYDEFSAESLLPPSTVTGAANARAFLASYVTEGFFTQRLAPSGLGIISSQLDRLIPVTAGSTYQAGITVLRRNSVPAEEVTSSVRTRIDWFDASGALFQADNPDQYYPASASGEYFGYIVTQTRTAPTGAAYAKISTEIDHTSSLVTHYYVDSIIFRESVAEYDLASDNVTGCVTLAVYTVPTSFAYDRITITRMDEDGKAAPLRGYGHTYDYAPYTPGPVIVEDYEAPLGSTVWYSVKWSTTTDPTRHTRLFTRTTVAPTLADGDYAWFKSPGNPALNTKVMIEAPLSWSRAARSARLDIVDRKNPIHITSKRSGRTTGISLLVWDPSANTLFDSLLDSGLPVLIQAMPGYGIEGNLYLSVGKADVDQLDPDAREHGWRWSLEVTEINRPDGGLQGSALTTWQSVYSNPLYVTWEDVFDTHATWTDLLTKG